MSQKNEQKEKMWRKDIRESNQEICHIVKVVTITKTKPHHSLEGDWKRINQQRSKSLVLTCLYRKFLIQWTKYCNTTDFKKLTL